MSSRRTPLTFDASGNTRAVDVTGCPWNQAVIEGSGTISGGTVTVQTAYKQSGEPEEGDWVTTGVTITASGASAGAQAYVQVPVGAYMYLRLKLTTPLSGGGTLTAAIVSNQSG